LSYVLISDIQAITADVWFGNWNSKRKNKLTK
jgi:hypothetical protein